MKVNITYPNLKKKKAHREAIIDITKTVFILLEIACILANIATKTPAWSVISGWGLCMVWNMVISPDIIEYNKIRQFVKLVVESCIMIILIDWLIITGWALDVIAIILFSSIIVVNIMLFTDYDNQKHNLLPAVALSIISLIVSIVYLIIEKNLTHWQLLVMGIVSFLMIIIYFKINQKDILNELKKIFHLS